MTCRWATARTPVDGVTPSNIVTVSIVSALQSSAPNPDSLQNPRPILSLDSRETTYLDTTLNTTHGEVMGMGATRQTTRLAERDVHDVLRNERRTHLLEVLQQHRETLPLREISEQVATLETGETPPPRNIRESVYNSLHQTHLPKLDKMDVVAYERDRKLVTLAGGSDQVSHYMETVPEHGITWATYYLAVGALALAVIGLSSVGMPVFAALPVIVWTTLFFGLLLLSTLYQLRGDDGIYLRYE